MRRLLPSSDFFDQALRLVGFVDQTGTAAKLPGVGVSVGISGQVTTNPVQARMMGRADVLELWSPTAQEVTVFVVTHDIAVDGGAVLGLIGPSDPGILTFRQVTFKATVVGLPDSSTVNLGTSLQVGRFPLLANTPKQWLPTHDISDGKSVLFIGQGAASRIVLNAAIRVRHMRNSVLLQTGG